MNRVSPAIHLPTWFAMLVLSLPVSAAIPNADTMSLDGTWQIVFDRTNEGNAAGWTYQKAFPTQSQRAIDVPSCWELTEKDYEGVAFYRHVFDVPGRWKGKVIRLHFDAVNFRAEVWLNDTAVGVHEGGFTPFEFRVDDLLHVDKPNTLIVRVVGPILLQNKRVDGIGPMETPQWRGAITGGIWQSVRLIATGDTYVDDAFIEPKLADNSATFHLQLARTAEHDASVRISIAIRPADRSEQADHPLTAIERRWTLHPGLNNHDVVMQIPNAHYWSPDRPFLYSAEVTVAQEDQISDRWRTRFGLREFTIRDKKFCLNGKPLYLKATFFEGLYPGGLAYPDSREMATREIELAKKAGFNMIRPWRKPPPPMWLDLADELGVLTVGSLAVECMDYPLQSANLPRWVENEVRESILRDRSRTCVVQWELFNELKRPVLKRLLRPMSILARNLDPTRLILDESGGWAQGANMFLPYQSEPTKFNDIHDYPGQKINDNVYQKLLLAGSMTHEEMTRLGLTGRLPGRNVVPGLMTFFSELGYGSLPDLEDNNRRFASLGNSIAPPAVYHQRLADQHRQALKQTGFDSLYPDLKSFCLDEQRIHGAANRRMIEAVRCNPNVAGYCIHALVAGDWVIGAGLLDLFRNPKTYAYDGTRAASQPRILSIRVRPRNVYAERGTTVDVTGVNELDAVNGQLTVNVIDADGTTVWKMNQSVRLESGITPLFSTQLDTKSLRGTYRIEAKLADSNGSLSIQNAYNVDVFTQDQLKVPDQRVAVFDSNNSLKPFLKRMGIEYEDFTPKTARSLPVLVSRTIANSADQRKKFAELAAFIETGGTVVYLQGGGPRVPWGKAGKASALLPIEARLKRALGHWISIPRLVKTHPIFDGLPTNCMMGAIYENVWPQSTLLDVKGETVAVSIGYDWFPDYDLSKRHYYGPGDTWWGSDMAIVPVGAGRCILSQFRLVENLGDDPVADRILFNLIRVAATQLEQSKS